MTEVKEQVNNLLYMKNNCFILEIYEIMVEISRAKSEIRIVHQLLAHGHKETATRR